MFRLRAAIGAMITQQQVAMFFGESFDTTFQAVIFQLNPVWIVWWRRHGVREFFSEVLEVDLVGHAEEVTRAIAAEVFSDFFEFAGDAVDCFVGGLRVRRSRGR